MSEPRVLSVNIGRPLLQRVPKGRSTGIGKQPVDVITVADPGPKRVEDGSGVSGVAGDHIGDGRHHGGSDQAVYAFARDVENLPRWAAGLATAEVHPGDRDGELVAELPAGAAEHEILAAATGADRGPSTNGGAR